MRLLLDTHAFLWWDENRLPRRVTAAILDGDEVHVSAVTACEFAIRSALGETVAGSTVADALDDYGFSRA